jgi:hypothetical protein
MEPKQQNKPLKIARVGVVIVMILGSTLMYLLWIGGRLGPTPPRILIKVPTDYQGPIVILEDRPGGSGFIYNKSNEIVFEVPMHGLISINGHLDSYNPRFEMIDSRFIEISIAEDTVACYGRTVEEPLRLVACSQPVAFSTDTRSCPRHIAWVVCNSQTCQREQEKYREVIVPYICVKLKTIE